MTPGVMENLSTTALMVLSFNMIQSLSYCSAPSHTACILQWSTLAVIQPTSSQEQIFVWEKNLGAKLILNVETLVIDDTTVNNNVGMLCCTKKLVYSQLLHCR